jgi:hypothetical protein
MSSYTKKTTISGVLLALTLTAVSACTVETPQQKLAYCQQYGTWATEAPSAAHRCGVDKAVAYSGPDLTWVSP